MRAGSAFLSADAILDFAGIDDGHVVVEIGPGFTGHTLFPAAVRVGRDGRVVGVDISKETLGALEGMRRQHLLHQVDFVWADIEDLRTEYPIVASADVVLLVNTAWMFKQHAEVFARLATLLHDKGKIVVVDWLPHAAHALAPRWDFRIDPQKLDVLLARKGLRAVDRAHISPLHWGRVYRTF